MKPIYKSFILQPGKLAVIFAGLLILQFAGCGERSEQVDDPTEVGETMNVNETITLNATLEGGPDGDPDGSGTASVTIDREAGEVCYELEVADIADPTVAHIHRGAAGESGGVAVDFSLPENGMSGCVTGADSSVIEEIIENPGNFYVNVHNDDHPGGAIRGQLANS